VSEVRPADLGFSMPAEGAWPARAARIGEYTGDTVYRSRQPTGLEEGIRPGRRGVAGYVLG